MPETSANGQRTSYGATGSTGSAAGRAAKSSRPGGAASAPAAKAEPPASKVEPKVFLASERTFFSWLRVALLLGSFSLALFNAGDKIARGMGLVYSLIAIATICYAWFMFQLRSKRINSAYSGNFDELYGPLTICVLLFAAVLANFIIRLRHHDGKMKPPKSPWLAAYMSNFLNFQDPSAVGAVPPVYYDHSM